MAEGRFQPGVSGNPAGRPKGIASGRMKALSALDRITAKKVNVKIMERAPEGALKEKPVWFFTNIVMPLLPRETRAEFEGAAGPCRVWFLSADNPDSIRGFGFRGRGFRVRGSGWGESRAEARGRGGEW